MATEKRLIDANALISILEEITEEDESMYFHLDEITQEIFDTPTVDAVEVVRCKYCKHWNEETGFCDEHSHFFEHGMCWDMFKADDFCSYGERKDNA